MASSMVCNSNKRSIEEVSDVEEKVRMKKSRSVHFEDFLSLGADVAASIFSFLVNLEEGYYHYDCCSFLLSSKALYNFARTNSLFMDIYLEKRGIPRFSLSLQQFFDMDRSSNHHIEVPYESAVSLYPGCIDKVTIYMSSDWLYCGNTSRKKTSSCCNLLYDYDETISFRSICKKVDEAKECINENYLRNLHLFSIDAIEDVFFQITNIELNDQFWYMHEQMVDRWYNDIKKAYSYKLIMNVLNDMVSVLMRDISMSCSKEEFIQKILLEVQKDSIFNCC